MVRALIPRGSLFFKGLPDNIRLYNRAWSDAAVIGLVGPMQPFDKSF